MSRRALTPLLLVASLLFGSFVSAQHAPEHAGPASHPDICAICVFAHGNGAGPASSSVRLDFATPELAFRTIDSAPASRGHRFPSRARGPPAFLA